MEPTAAGLFRGHVDPGWFIVRGPNGGYVAAMLLRAFEALVGDPTRTPRSLTIHYTSPPAEGTVEIETRVEREGRSLTTMSARILQNGKLLALALAAFSRSRDGYVFDETRFPEVLPPEKCAPSLDRNIPMHERYETRFAVGDLPFTGSERALSGGWIRLSEEPRVVDAALVAAYTDAWPPALFSRLNERGMTGGVPTIDLNIHFRSPLPPTGAAANDYTLAVFRSQLGRDGFLEEDGEIWSRDGVLLAQSRQLGVIF